MRKHYMTLNFRDNTEITHMINKGRLEVTYEQSCKGGFKTLITDIDGNVISNIGFNASDIAFFCNFTKTNALGISAESRGDI